MRYPRPVGKRAWVHAGGTFPVQNSRINSGGLARVFLAEFVHTSGGVHDFLLAGEERMALRANFNMQIPFERGARHKFVAATAGHGGFLIFGVGAGFHGSSGVAVLRGAHDSVLTLKRQV